MVAHVSGFETFRHALQFEWAFKHACRRFGWSCTKRLSALADVLQRQHWTRNSPPASGEALVLHVAEGHAERVGWPGDLSRRCTCALRIVVAAAP